MSAPIKEDDTVSQRLTKLLPADITSALLGIKGAVAATTLPDHWVIDAALSIGILSPLYFWFVVETRNIFHIVFLVASYAVFILTIAPLELGNYFPAYRTNIEGLNVIITPIWVFVVTPIVARMLGRQLVG